MKRYIISVLLLLLAAACCVSCVGKKEIKANPDAVPYDIVSSTLTVHPELVSAQTIFYSEAEDELDRLDEFFATQFLGDGSEYIDLELFSAYCVMSTSAASASEIGVLKLKDEADAETVVNYVNAHFIRIESNFSSYIEAEAEIARNVEIRTSGCFVYYAATADNAAALSTMENALTK